ncbi:MAG: hypothetical protein JJ957_07960 [Pseudomonadales bacterium]|nr:hypothetical protein [Pseudomonadales bacterium]MBO6597926.1 hypothetical protein [Pseudomonadales bacterium]MBO6823052.1 hypothetical protein [Pseudomonadales bacterium]
MTNKEEEELQNSLKKLDERAQQRIVVHDPAEHSIDPNSECCSFCGLTPIDQTEIISGPGVRICGKCVDLCVDILEEQRRERGT